MILDEHIEQDIRIAGREISELVPSGEILAQIAEEAAELSQAALKLRRALTKTNPTPVSPTDAWEKMMEEYADVMLAVGVFTVDEVRVQDIRLRKSARWLKRLRETKDREFCKKNGPQKN